MVRLRDALAALHADVAVEGEMADLAAEQAGRHHRALLDLLALAELCPGRLLLGEIGDGVVAEDDEIAARDLNGPVEIGAPLLGLGPKGLGGEIERSRRDDRGGEREGGENHRPPPEIRPATPPTSCTSLPSARATKPRDRTRYPGPCAAKAVSLVTSSREPS